MILSSKPLTLAQVRQYVGDSEDKKTVIEYLKEFTKLSPEKAQKMEEELRALGNVKIKEEYVIKVIDLLPRDAEDVHKIFHDVSLDEQEIAAILGIVSNY